jgi:hypothetical protein
MNTDQLYLAILAFLGAIAGGVIVTAFIRTCG